MFNAANQGQGYGHIYLFSTFYRKHAVQYRNTTTWKTYMQELKVHVEIKLIGENKYIQIKYVKLD